MKNSAVLFAALCALSSPPAPGADEPAFGAVMKIMTFNVLHCEGMDKKLDIARTAARIASEKPDFACLQEIDMKTERVSGVDEPAELARLTGMHATFAKAIPFRGGEYGVMMLSREKPVDVVKYPLPGKEPRVLLVCEFKDCVVATSHLSVSGKEEREASVPIIRDAFAKYDKPVFFTGDWNARPESEVLKLLGEFLVVLSDQGGRTYHGRSEIGPGGVLLDKTPYCIDYIAVDRRHAPGFRVVDTHVVEDRVTSDHAPVVATLQACAGAIRVASPDGRNEMRLEGGDSLKCSVWRDGKRRLDAEGVALSVRGRNFPARIVSSERFTLSGEECTPIYKKSSVSLAANGCRVSLGEGFAVELVARDDGVAYRFSTDLVDGEVLVDGETADVSFPELGTSLWIGYPDINIKGGQRGYITGWEPVYTNLSAGAAGASTNWFIALPLVAEYGDGVCVCVTESDQRDYPGWMLRGSGKGGRFCSEFAREPVEELCTGTYHHGNMTRHDYIARTTGRRTYPWRLFAIAASCAKLCEGDAPYALAQPCQLDDVSWIRPGLVQWDWWHARNLTRVDFRAGLNTATYLHYVDFAADNGIPYVIVDGGWSADYNVLNHKPEIDVFAVAARARERGVALILWTPWAALIGRQEETFAAYERIGVKGAKIDGISRNDRYLTAFLEETARIAARHHIVIDYHGVSKPSGLSRAYPNVLTYEGVHGLENTKWEGGDYMAKCDFPRNDLTCLFCRMPAGPMDYTPGAMRNFAKGLYRFSNTEPGSDGTRARQLAMYVMYESPLQMLSDSPTLYMENRECFDFMRSVPTVWDETRGLDGRIGEWAAVARRSGETWYVGAMTDWTARELEIPTDFLGCGEWQAEAFADGVNADRNGTDWCRQSVRVRAGGKIRVSLAPGGGWAARLARVRCD